MSPCVSQDDFDEYESELNALRRPLLIQVSSFNVSNNLHMRQNKPHE